jgi:hypothetical protein
MEEPSLLDYLKLRLRFWKRDGFIPIPAEQEILSTPAETEEKKEIPSVDTGREIIPAETKPEINKVVLPWRSLLALLFILLAQRTFEPSPSRNAITGIVLYVIGLAWVVLAGLKGEWVPAKSADTDESTRVKSPEEKTNTRVRILPLVLTALFSLAAFLAFSNNRFTLLNVLLWILALVCFLWTFWIPHRAREHGSRRIGSIFQHKSWTFHIDRWTILLLVVIGLVVFFRTTQINSVPSEPISDHAEKILDVYDVTQGGTSIFFPRNTGREALQIYLTVGVAWLFGTGLTFLSLKIGTILCGLLTLPYMYLLGRDLGGKRVALLALLFTGIAYWPNVISRIGLRFPLYPLFVAPTLFYLLRGLRSRSRNDFILAGIFLGIGLHGYSPIRILPIVVVLAVALFLVHAQSKGARRKTIYYMVMLVVASIILFLPLLRYWVENPQTFGYRAFSRLSSIETTLPGPAVGVFFSNLWNGIKMFNWDDGEIWVHSVTHRPALDIVSGAFFLAGVTLLLVRYIKKRNWMDLFLLLSIPLLQLPSILSLAYPAENPALNRAGGAIVPVFLVVALAFDGLWSGIRARLTGRGGAILAWSLGSLLIVWSCVQNYNLVFHQFTDQYDRSSWNTSEMGNVIEQFGTTYGTTDQAWIIPYPHWVDTRLPGVWAGIPNRDFAVWPDNLETTLGLAEPKLFIVNLQDETGQVRLEELYPTGTWSHYNSTTGLDEKDFLIYFIPAQESR